MEKIEILKSLRDEYKLSLEKEVEEALKNPIDVVLDQNRNNVVTEEKLRAVQKHTLAETKEFLSKTFGPMGSNTKIITGEEIKTVQAIYSKDGAKVLSYIMNSNPLEASIVEELIEITRRVDKEVGDGTTSTVILSSLIFDGLINIQNKYNIPPYKLMRLFDKQVENIKKLILDRKKEATLGDVYDISMISTNGNETIANTIKSIYNDYGMDMDLSVGISNTVDNVIRVYDGFTITEGMENSVFVNNIENNTCEIHNARVYHFVDPIDDISQITLLEAILKDNIYDKLKNKEQPIPTVITCPRVSRDLSVILKELTNILYQYNAAHAELNKPPVLIITNVVASDEAIMEDIANLCGCKNIKKYIDPKVYERDKENGDAPLVSNVANEFYGTCELVIADSKKTKFINPKYMHKEDENGNIIEDPRYTSLVGFLETEIKEAENSGDENAAHIGFLKKRLSALKANMAEFLVGGVTIADRDAVKDLVEDAVKNCKSALKFGVGYAANFEGLRASYENIINNIEDEDQASKDIAKLIFNAYFNISEILYRSVCRDDNIVEDYVYTSLNNDAPFNISSGELPNKEEKGTNVKCAIMLDIQVLDTISRIISKMATCNQLLVQAPKLNYY